MPEKGVNLSQSSSSLFLRSSRWSQWRFGLLTTLVFVGMVVLWSIDDCSIKSQVQSWRFKQQFPMMRVNSIPDINETSQNLLNHSLSSIPVSSLAPNSSPNETSQNLLNHSLSSIPVPALAPNPSSNETSQNLLNHSLSSIPVPALAPNPSLNEISQNLLNHSLSSIPVPALAPNPSPNSTRNQKNSTQSEKSESVDFFKSGWVSAELEPNFTANLLARWKAPGGEVCKDSKTVGIEIPNLDGKELVELSAGEVHEFGFRAVDERGNGRCLGGDYFEADLSGESWKSRPLLKDFDNGSYSISLQVHPDFAGDYNLTVILLFRHFEGLKFSPARFVYDRKLISIGVRFYRSNVELPKLQICQKSDFERDVWSGRWTRLGKNDDCQISNDGRYRCLAPDFPCQNPWCNGSLGLLESNGWVYSSHCSFRLFSAGSAWDCLKNRWIFFWGDSNHVDTIRNMLNFMLALPQVQAVPRRFDMNFTNPKDTSQSVRITSIFNGHWNETQNYLGLDSLKDEGFRNLLKMYFSGETVPDTIIMNSGLHDGVHWHNLRSFIVGVEYAASFWKEVMDSVRQSGLPVPQIFYRTTVATGGYARSLAFNPSKMEAFNGVAIEKFRQVGLVTGVIDNFDMTFPWHFDNRCNDGVHYGRAPLKMKWRDGEIGHQYFVDLMLGHVLLNALCTTPDTNI